MTTFKSAIKRFLPITAILTVIAVMCIAPDTAYAKKTTKKKQTTSQTGKKTSSSKTRTSADVKNEKKKTEKEIAETRKKLTDNEKQTRDQLDRLNSINSQIERQESTIADLTATISEIELNTAALADSIVDIEYQDSLLVIEVARSLRSQHAHRAQLSPLAFVLSASSYAEGQRRISYLQQLERAHNKRIRALRDNRALLQDKRAMLDSLSERHNHALKQLENANQILDTRRRESAKAVADLKREGATLNKVLADKRAKARQLESELNRIIEEEMRRQREEAERKKRQQQSSSTTKPSSGKPSASKPSKPSGTEGTADEDRILTGSFVSNKGKLLFPVAGKYTIVGSFGRSQHGDLDHVQVDNSGIDIQVSAGTTARAVFNGTVSSVFFMDGYENIVIVRHGEYLTVYAGLSNIKVSKGASVNAGTILGTVATIDGRTVLHFEVRKERTKLNPLEWVR